MSVDVVNALFEFTAGCLLWLNVRAAYKAKRFAGVAIVPTALFALWGYWNIYYYPSLNQWWSLFGGLNVVTANTVWVVQMVYYRRPCAEVVAEVAEQPSRSGSKLWDEQCWCGSFPCECGR